jgi:peroxiredoxin Q/BCP
VVLGVSPDDCLCHAGFRDQHGVSIRLLADTESEVCRKYGVVHEKEANGSMKSCITRSTFVIDKEGTVRHAFYGVNPRGHAAQVLDLVRSLR